MKSALLAALLIFAFSCAPVLAQETPIPQAPTRWVTDTAQFLSPQTVQALDRQLEAYERQSGHQLIVYIGQTTGDAPIEDWAVRAFQQWQVGRQGMDDGLVLFVMAQDRRLRIEVGYGLEGDVPDLTASRIINEVMVPRIQAGNPDEAITAGMEAVVQTISGQGFGNLTAPGGGARQGDQARRPIGIGQLILFGIMGIVFLILLATNPTLAIYLLASVLSGGRGGHGRGGGFGGGGFSGGGGRSGGGGASGSW